MNRLRSTRLQTNRALVALIAALTVCTPGQARASLFSGDTLDAVANGIAWVVLVIAPIIGIVVFWLVHILPEKIAHNRKHPQTRAIQCLCLLSLFFGGLLWPIAWLWAYSKPVLYRMAYGKDTDETLAHDHPPGEVINTEQAAASAVKPEAKNKGGHI